MQDYIDAGTLKLYELDSKTLPELRKKLEEADPHDSALGTQELQRAQSFRDRLSKRVYNLKLAQQVALLPRGTKQQDHSRSGLHS